MAPEKKLVPVIVMLNGLPAVMLEGLTALTVGGGYVTENCAAEDVPPPGAGVTTVTGTLAGFTMFDAGTEAVNCVLLT